MPQSFALTSRQMYTSRTVAEPESQLLTAGPLTLQFENGSLRYLKLGNFEVIRMLYAAVRDQNWLTVPPEITVQSLHQEKNRFQILFTNEYKKEEIHFIADYKITGSAAGDIRFEMQGRAITAFLTNRIGFCVLHPIRECAGKPVQLTSPDGQETTAIFPEYIQPYQPFKNIAAMRWQLPGGGEAILKFTGDIFETEDQRNWSDASYKTYCTPLEKPYPVPVQPGQEFKQSLELTLSGLENVKISDLTSAPDELIIKTEKSLPLPTIGVSQSTEVRPLAASDISKIKALGLDHYRVEVKISEPDWEKLYAAAVAEAKALEIPLLVTLQLNEDYEKEVPAFIKLTWQMDADLQSLLLLPACAKTPDFTFLNLAVPLLRRAYPHLKIGTGTNAYFAELNRRRPPIDSVDFLSYSLNPQVHAADQASLTENLAAQADTVRSAQQFAGGKAIYVSPVTLKPRFNPDATRPVSEEEPLEAPVDVRQMSLYGAGWALGSLKYLAEAGAAAITYFETVGRKGLFLPVAGQNKDAPFPAGAGVFPMYIIFQEILAFKGAVVYPCQSTQPLVYSGLVLVQEKSCKIFIANHTANEIKVRVKLKINNAVINKLNAEVWAKAGDISAGFAETEMAEATTEEDLMVLLSPYAILVIWGEID